MVFRGSSTSQFKKMKGKGIEATRNHMKQFQNVLKTSDFTLLEVILDDDGFASKRNNDVRIEKDTDAPVTIVVHDSDSESSEPSGDEVEHGDDFSEDITDIESASDDEEEEEDDDVDEFEHSGDEF